MLVVLDVFSRFLFLIPLQSKSSTEVASVVVQIFSDVGPPKIIQTDQGTERGTNMGQIKIFIMPMKCSF